MVVVVVGVGPSHNIFAGFFVSFFSSKKPKKGCIFRVLQILCNPKPYREKKREGAFLEPTPCKKGHHKRLVARRPLLRRGGGGGRDKERGFVRLDTTTTTTTTTTMRVIVPASARLSKSPSSLTSSARREGCVVPERWRLCSRHDATTMMRTRRRRPEKSIVVIIRAMAKKGSKSSNDEPEGFGFPRYAARKLAIGFSLSERRACF